jgi:hypothetical protein
VSEHQSVPQSVAQSSATVSVPIVATCATLPGGDPSLFAIALQAAEARRNTPFAAMQGECTCGPLKAELFAPGEEVSHVVMTP